MPLLRLETTVVLSDEKRRALLASLSKIVAGTIGKPEQYVMVAINPAAMLMSGKSGGDRLCGHPQALFQLVKDFITRDYLLACRSKESCRACEALRPPVGQIFYPSTNG